MTDTGFSAWARSYLGDLTDRTDGDAPSVAEVLERVSGAVGKVVDDALVVVGEVAKAFDPEANEEMAGLLAELKGGFGRLVDQIEGLLAGGENNGDDSSDRGADEEE